MPTFLSDLILLFQRMTWLSVLDILLVTVIFYAILTTLQDTQAMALLRGILFLILVLGLVTSIFPLTALSWLLRTALPALIFAIPVIFAPEIRRTLENIGRARFSRLLMARSPLQAYDTEMMISAVVKACTHLADQQIGALIVLQQMDKLTEFINTGVRMDARITAELLLQVFYPNTPLHDGAAILVGDRLVSAGCVIPLSESKTLNQTPDREAGLRHRAALGIAEVSDAIALVVSEETGTISMANHSRLIKRISAEKLEKYLQAFYNKNSGFSLSNLFARLERSQTNDKEEQS